MTPHSFQSAAVPDWCVSRLTHTVKAEQGEEGVKDSSLRAIQISCTLFHPLRRSSLPPFSFSNVSFAFPSSYTYLPPSLFTSSGACFSLLPPSRPLNFSAFNFSLYPTISPLSWCFFFSFSHSPYFPSQNRVRLGFFFFFSLPLSRVRSVSAAERCVCLRVIACSPFMCV